MQGSSQVVSPMNSWGWPYSPQSPVVGTLGAMSLGMTASNIATQSTTHLFARLLTLESLYRTSNDHSRDVIVREHRAIRAELDRRPTDAVLAAL